LNKLPFLASKVYDFVINERIVEYPFIYTNIGLEQGRILDVGSGNSKLPLELASLGYKVWALDIIKYPYPAIYPNLTLVQADIRKAPFESDFFDRVTAVSCIEHIGLEGEDDFNGDREAITECRPSAIMGHKRGRENRTVRGWSELQAR
jgi:2-polyprenyl-3-methyl-5-hydroxy-6-metoxy-1,4-benzoquinol methylase